MIVVSKGAFTLSIAFLTRSESMSPLVARFLMRAALLEPELRQAIVVTPRREPPPMSLTTLMTHNVTTAMIRARKRVSLATFAKI